MTRQRLVWVVCGSLLYCGCGSYEVTSNPKHRIARKAPAENGPEEPAADEAEPEADADAPPADAPAAEEQPPLDPDAEDPFAQQPETRDVGEVDPPENFGNDPVTAPLAVFLNVRDRPEMLRMEQAVRDFEVLEGRFPTDLDEFMERIVRENEIELPPVQPGYELDYLPDEGKLIQRRVDGG